MHSSGWRLPGETEWRKFVEAHCISADAFYTHIGLFTDAAGQTFVGVALDEDDRLIRRVLTPVSDEQIAGLIARSLTLRDVFAPAAGTTYYVEDYSHEDGSTCVWTCSAPLPEDVLPTADTHLPESIAKELDEWRARQP